MAPVPIPLSLQSSVLPAAMAVTVASFLRSLFLLSFATVGQQAVITEPTDNWTQYIRSPSSSNVKPVAVVSTAGAVTNPNAFLTGQPTTLNRPAGSSTVPSIVVDFGQNIVGYLSINFGGATSFGTGAPGVRLAFSETLEYLSDTCDFTRSDNGATITPGSDQIAVQTSSYTWTEAYGCQHGTQVCADGLHGFRYLKIYLDALSADAPYTSAYSQVTINSMSLAFSGYISTPGSFSGYFQSSDSQLNQWWFDGAYTTDMCIDTFRVNDTEPRNAGSASLIGKLVIMDGAKRDRDPYVGDLAVSARTSYVTHNTVPFISLAARNVLADLADHQRSDGWIPPASIVGYGLQLLDYPLYWVTCSYDYLMYTGDTTYFAKYYANMVLLLDTYYPAMTDSTTQLLNKGLGTTANYGDYAFLGRTGQITYLNALYVMALKNAAVVATSLGKTGDATRWNSRAGTVSAAINAHRFDTSVGAFFDGDCSGVPCATHAQDGNSLAVVSGAVNTTIAQSALGYLAKANARNWGNAFYDNDVVGGGYSQRVYAFISYFEIQARFIAGLPDTALEEIRRLYEWMSSNAPGITQWEGIGDSGSLYEGAFTSAAHGWSTGVTPALTNYVLGVIPTGPGFKTWTIKPYPGSQTFWAKGNVTTPSGPIHVYYISNPGPGLFYLTATTPTGTSGVVSVPVANSTVPVYVNGALTAAGTSGTSISSDGYFNIPVTGGSVFAVSVGFVGTNQ